jgi:hypothetical protein
MHACWGVTHAILVAASPASDSASEFGLVTQEPVGLFGEGFSCGGEVHASRLSLKQLNIVTEPTFQSLDGRADGFL